MKMPDLPKHFVVVTHYLPPNNKPAITHVYGGIFEPWTKSKAITTRRQMLKEPVPDGGTLTIHVCQITDVESMNNA